MSDNSDQAFEETNKSEMMIEDEEMPTFISVSSNKDISLPYNTVGTIQLLAAIDNNSVNNSSSLIINETTNNEDQNHDDYEAQSRSVTTEEREEEVNDENEDGSVYVLSSGDDADDPDDPSTRSYDEDVDDEEDEVDDEDDEDIDGEIFQISYYPASEMDEIEGEEDEVGVTEDGQLLGDFSEDEIEKEDVMSDDMALRPDKPTPINSEKRSQSLQDLSEYKPQPKRKSFITGGGKYNRVQSKVKRYIQDLKDINRRSAENRLKIIENNKEYNIKVAEEKQAEEYLKKSSKGRRSIKDYAEKALKDLEMREEEEVGSPEDEENELQDEEDDEEEEEQEEMENCIIRPNNNLQTKRNSKTVNQRYANIAGFETAAEIYKARKMNINGENLSAVNNDGLKNVKIPKGITLNYTTTLNGQIQDENILDVRSIGYDEYMRGSSNFVGEKNAEKEETGEKLTQDIQMATSKFEITNIRSELEPNNIEMMKDIENFEEETPMELVVDDEKNTENNIEKEKLTGKENKDNKINKEEETLAEMAIIQSQLNQKTTQCKEIRDAYEKTLSENFQLKQELEDLKKTMAKLTAKKPPSPQLITVAIQTDPPPLPPPQISNETRDPQASDSNFLNPKTSTSTIASAISSNEHWTESAGSLPMSNGSIRPLPNLTPLSNAEDSFIGVASTPTRTPKQPSHAFQTSSKIIKMLSSITSRKSKGEANLYREENSSNIFSKGSSAVAPSPGISNCNYNSPINHRVSNKRKASDMPENANILQPSKIPHTSSSSGSSNRLNKRNKSEFKYPGDFIKPNSQSQCSSSLADANLNRTLENLENSQREDEPNNDDLNSGVKCFTYREDQNSRETSFLIQAEDEAKSQKTRSDGGERNSIGIVRECGPYLLGNVEVRMTEINGTINIWGKEVLQEKTIVEDEPEEEEEEKGVDMEDEMTERACGCWHNTPNARLSSIGPMSCSTNKKPKIPVLRLNDSTYSKNHYNSPTAITSDNFKERQNMRNIDNDDNLNCRVCNSRNNNSRLGFNRFKRYTNFGEEETEEEEAEEEDEEKEKEQLEEDNNEIKYYQCNWDNENCDNNHSSCDRVSRHHSNHQNHIRNHSEHNCASNNYNLRGGTTTTTTSAAGTSRCSRFNNNFVNDNNRRLLLKTEEDNLNRNKSSRLLSNNFQDCNLASSSYSSSASCRHHGLRKDSRDLDDDVFKRPSTSNNRINNDGCCKNESCTRSRSTSISNQSNEPLLSHNPHEPPETRRRRSSGKRVRGILMDFLRGCGDCRTTNGPENKVSPSIVPQIQIRSDTPPPSFVSQNQQQQQRGSNSHGSGNKKCVHMECCATCSKRIEMAAEIETQLEIFGAEMERLRSRSQAVLGMLNTLHSADNTN